MVTASRCLPPTDPSFFQALGPLVVLPDQTYARSSSWSVLGSYKDFTVIRVTCPENFHFEPLKRSLYVDLTCSPNGVWMDWAGHTIRRCQKNLLQCVWPLTDLGGRDCEPVVPMMDLARGDTAGRWSYHPMENDPNPYPYGNWSRLAKIDGGEQGVLYVSGNAFFEPVQISVGGYPCLESSLAGSSASGNICYNVTDATAVNGKATVCVYYSSIVKCLFPMDAATAVMTIEVVSGLHSTPAALVDGLTLQAALNTPKVTAVLSDSCSVQPGLSLTECPLTQSSKFSLCVAGASASANISVLFNSENALPCQRAQGAAGCNSQSRKIDCSILPQVGSNIRLRVVQSMPYLEALEAPTVSFAPCPVGYMLIPPSIYSAPSDPTNLCSICPVGSSTQGVLNAQFCVLCPAGSFSDRTGSVSCTDCPVGYFASSSNSSTCQRCPRNSYQNSAAQTRCDVCGLNQYIVYSGRASDNRNGSSIPTEGGMCIDCPESAECSPNGNVTAAAGSFLLVDQQKGTVHSRPCPAAACLSGADEECGRSTDAPYAVSRSLLSVKNCCATGRLPAYSSDYLTGDTPLSDTAGVNVLCSLCQPDYTQANGVCIYCPRVNFGILLPILLLATVVVYCLHRVPRDSSSSATLVVTSYFIQQTALFLGSNTLPAVTNLANLNLLGDTLAPSARQASGSWTFGFCVLPLSDYGRLVVGLLSPLLLFLLLALIGGMQAMLWRAVQRLDPGSTARRWYTHVFEPTQEKSSAHVHSRRDRWLSADRATLLQGQELMPLDQLPDRPAAMSNTLLLTDRSIATSSCPSSPAPTTPFAYQCTLVRLTQLSYTSTAVLTLSFFHFIDVGTFGLRLARWNSISPTSFEYRALLPFIIVVLVCFVHGVPLLLGGWLALKYRRGVLGAVKPQPNPSGGGDRETGTAWAHSGAERPQELPVIMTAPSRESVLLLQLCGMYRESCWWMAVFALFRRLLLVAVLVSVRDATVWVWLTVVNCALLCVHLRVLPYVKRRDNQLECVNLIALVGQTTLLAVNTTSLPGSVIGALLVLAVGPIVALCLSLLHEKCVLARGADRSGR